MHRLLRGMRGVARDFVRNPILMLALTLVLLQVLLAWSAWVLEKISSLSDRAPASHGVLILWFQC